MGGCLMDGWRNQEAKEKGSTIYHFCGVRNMKKVTLLVCCFQFVILTGCTKEKPTTSENMKASTPSSDQQNPGEVISYDDVVQPEGKAIKQQLYVENSEPVNPGVKINLIDNDSSPPRVIIAGVTAEYVRWKVSGPFTAPKYPASGFVTLTLTENQWKALEGKEIIIKKNNEVE